MPTLGMRVKHRRRVTPTTVGLRQEGGFARRWWGDERSDAVGASERSGDFTAEV